MSGFQHDVAGGQGNLVVPSMQSPNFVDGVQGWQISKDGSAEFNNLEIRGSFFGTDYIINSSGTFAYSGTPAAGNLINSSGVSFGSTDSFGNNYLAGASSYGSGIASSITAGGVTFYTGSLSAGWSSVSTIAYLPASSELFVNAGQVQFNAALVEMNGDLTVLGTALTVNGVNIITALSGAAVNGSSAMAGLTDGTIHGTSGAQSAGTAHTHGPGSFAVGNGQHNHGAGTYVLPTI